MNIFENLENLNVSEECFNDIIGIVEEIINELKAPTPELATAVMDRKTAKLQANTTKNELLANHKAEANKSDFHNRYANNSTQNRYNYENELNKEKGKVEKESQSLNTGGSRLFRWAAKQKQKGKLTNDMRDSANRMRQAGQINTISHAENP